MKKIALGTVQFGLPYGIANQDGQINNDMAKEILSHCEKIGLDTIDTAMVYGDSETVIGSFGRSQNFKIITKLPPIDDKKKLEKDSIKEMIYKSLSNLNINQLEGLLLHSSKQLLGVNGKVLYEALEESKADGLVKKIGISVYSPLEAQEIISQYKIDLLQMPFNLLDQRIREAGFLKELKEEGVEIHVRSIFLQGLLLMESSQRPRKFSKWLSTWGSWHDWLELNRVSAMQACLSLPLAFPEIDRIVVGVDNILQLQEILEAANNPLPLTDLPSLACNDKDLINPALWSKL